MTRYLVCPRCKAVLQIDAEPDPTRMGSKKPTYRPTCPFCASGEYSNTQLIICENFDQRWDAEKAILDLDNAMKRVEEFRKMTFSPKDEPAGGV